MLLNRKRVNKGMKRTNSLPLSPVVISYATLQRKSQLTSPNNIVNVVCKKKLSECFHMPTFNF